MAPLCSAECRPGRPSEAAQALGEQLGAVLEGGGVLDRRQLCIDAGKAAWAVYLDLYVLDAGGCCLPCRLYAWSALVCMCWMQVVAASPAVSVPGLPWSVCAGCRWALPHAADPPAGSVIGSSLAPLPCLPCLPSRCQAAASRHRLACRLCVCSVQMQSSCSRAQCVAACAARAQLPPPAARCLLVLHHPAPTPHTGGHLESFACPRPWQRATLTAAQRGLGSAPNRG